MIDPRPILILVCAALAATSGWRWLEHGLSAPTRLEGPAGEGFVLVVNERDCTESRVWLRAWIAPLADRGIPVRATLLGTGGGGPQAIDLGEGLVLPRGGRGFERRAERVLLRAGVTRTPALVLVDAGGAPVLVQQLGAGPPEAVEAGARLLGDLHLQRIHLARSSRRPL